MAVQHKQYVKFDRKIIIIGFGSIGQAILPLILRHLVIAASEIIILTKSTAGLEEARAFGVALHPVTLTRENYEATLQRYVSAGDVLLNVSVDVESLSLIQFCAKHGMLYLDTCIEPWAGGYTNPRLSIAERSNYAMREAVLALKRQQAPDAPTALLTHGANPGLVSHFLKQALMNLAHDTGLAIEQPETAAGWAALSKRLHIKAIHIAERDTQSADRPKQRDEFVNTWSVDGFVAEGSQPAELGWGSHEKHWPAEAEAHLSGPQCAIYLKRPGAATRVRTWTPLSGPFHGFLITHGEAISISDYLTVREAGKVIYRPTVHYAYHPCEDAILSLHELAGLEWQQQTQQRLLSDEIVDGMDELGVLLMGHPAGAYWFGSQLSIHEARALAPYNNATSLQVAASVLAGLIWVIEHPQAGIVEPDEIDHQAILNIAKPYLGQLSGHYTDWTPLKARERLFTESLDPSDAWQFKNILVD